MASTALLHCCGLFVVLFLLVGDQAVYGRRISETKCMEYRRQTMRVLMLMPLVLNPTDVVSTRFNCSKTIDLIVGGEAADPGEFPHQAVLGFPKGNASNEYSFDCGGTLISDRFVLTAAHCFANGYPKIVRLGANKLKSVNSSGTDFAIDACTKHPKHKFRLVYNDIALIKLAKRVKPTQLIRPACLWTGSSFNFSSVVATGFGLNETDGEKADVLQKVKLDLMDRGMCDETFGSLSRFSQGILDSQICIGSDEGGKDTCQGDSGGPVQIITEPKGCTYHVVGVTSTSSKGCGVGKAPAIYTRVSSYLDWIEDVVWGNGIGTQHKNLCN